MNIVVRVICNVICAPEKPALELNAIINPTDDGIVDIPDLTGDSISRAFLHFSSVNHETQLFIIV